jgi:hypothetical protein
MRKPSFSLEKFAASNVRTLESDELQLITGANMAAGLCSDHGDTDNKSSDCSNSNDTDNDPIIIIVG